MQPNRSLKSKLIRFLTVGAANTVVDFSVFAALLTLEFNAFAANVCAWIVAVSFSYFANSRWSFEASSELGDRRSAPRFLVSGAIISLGVSTLTIALLSSFVPLWTAKVIGTGIATVLNFFASKWSIEGSLT